MWSRLLTVALVSIACCLVASGSGFEEHCHREDCKKSQDPAWSASSELSHWLDSMSRVEESAASSVRKVHFRDGTLKVTDEDSGLVRRFGCRFGNCTDKDGDDKPTYLQKICKVVNGRHIGYAWEFKAGGGAVVGRVDPNDGSISGSDVVYLYPDNYTMLVGNFSKGVLVAAKAAVLYSVRYEDGIAIPVASAPLSYDVYTHEPSNSTHMLATASGLHLADPMETRLLRVDVSTEEDAGLGLFLRLDVRKDQALAFYSGITANKKTYNKKSFYRQEISLESENEIVDIPVGYRLPSEYNASLAHFTNHNPEPNAYYGIMDHPRFGKRATLFALRPLAAGTELFSDYGYVERQHRVDTFFESLFDAAEVLTGRSKSELADQVRDKVKMLRPVVDGIRKSVGSWK